MPNLYQVAFLASFAGTSAILYLTLEFVKAKLHARGIYISDLILLGLPVEPRKPDPEADMVDLLSSQYGQLVALALALVTSVVVFLKFGRGSTCLRLPRCLSPAPSH